MYRFCILLLISILLYACKTNKETTTAPHTDVMTKVHSLKSTFEVDQIIDSKTKSSWTITNHSETDLPNSGWALYYNQIVAEVDTENLSPYFTYKNISGDFHSLSPTSSFPGIKAGASMTFHYPSNFGVLRMSFLPQGAYIAFEDERTINLDHKNEILDHQFFLGIPDPKSRFEEHQSMSTLDKSEIFPIIPRPNQIKKLVDGFTVSNTLRIAHEGFQHEADILKNKLSKFFTGTIEILSIDQIIDGKGIFLLKDAKGSEKIGAYEMKIGQERIIIKSNNNAGIFYGIQSLAQLIPLAQTSSKSNTLSIDGFMIKDEPRFAYRGFMVDVARHFHPKEEIKRILDLMAYYKMNKFHFHLTDDEGWRLEMDGLPELTEIGSKRGHTLDESENIYPFYGSGPDANNSYGSGYYTKNDFIEILKYAHERHIEVIPEIGLPGHSRAAIKSMTARYHKYMKAGNVEAAHEFLLEDFDDESKYSSAQGYTDNVICICLPSSIRFMEKVVNNLTALFKEADVPFKVFHTGGDEIPYGAWLESPVCKKLVDTEPNLQTPNDVPAYFLNKFKTLVDQNNLAYAGWEEIALRHTEAGHDGIDINEDLIGKNMRPYVWNAIWGSGREDMIYKLANLGYPVVFCNSSQFYLDMAYNSDPHEEGLSWSGFTTSKSPFQIAPFDIFKTVQSEEIASTGTKKVKITDQGIENFLGIQGQIWSETLRNTDRLYYMLFPKLLSLAERAWAAPSEWEAMPRETLFPVLEKDWNAFANMIGQYHLPYLDVMHPEVKYRIPLPGAKIENGFLKANCPFPGMQIRYTLNGAEPDGNSPIYIDAFETNVQTIKLKTFTHNGRSSRTSTVVNEK